MARPRSADHDLKRRAILDRSAALFAQNGYDRTAMAEVARPAASSKALLYHYYESKERCCLICWRTTSSSSRKR